MDKIYTGDFKVKFVDPCSGYHIDVIRSGNTVEFLQADQVVHTFETDTPTIKQRLLLLLAKRIRGKQLS